ncbi:hypothetical protein [Collinsella aerofaciens]|uniref:hypothetical protein n=1 Tax=Collinsella aerofaciens TaxID=74426 RepID=UPI00232D0545|nr:hypothetical protein [Collinsella aerofaciens]MDB1855119.1 hypothetical protein [Collinsella aerofaciens]
MMEVPLPKDHEGREIPLDTEVLYDANGKEVNITSFTFRRRVYGHWSNWKVLSPDARGEEGMLPVNELYLTPPDSWGKLLEDLNEGANHSEYSPCFYFRKDMCDCSSCEADRYSSCDQPAFKDIASRIRKLRGEGDAD